MLCALGGCASTHPASGPLAPATTTLANAAPALPWWNSAGDPVLARLVHDGLAADPRLRREALWLATTQEQSHQWRWRLARWIARELHQTPEAPDTLALRLADARQRQAARIARSYVEVRRLQASLALRQAFQDHFHDDADYARWRHEAGLVSAVDGGLAASLVGTNARALASTRDRLAAAQGALARLTGTTPARLDLMLDDGARVPKLDVAGAAQAAGAACGDAHPASPPADRTSFDQIERDADRTVRDARAAYHLGTGNFATLYVAETAALATREARVKARAQRARTAIALWTQAGLRRNHGGQPPASAAPAQAGPAVNIEHCHD